MSESSTITVGIAEPTTRKMNPDELCRVLATNLQRRGLEGTSDPCETGHRREQVGWVAEADPAHLAAARASIAP